MIRIAPLLSPIILLFLLAHATAAPDETTIDGGGLAHGVQLARIDEDAFMRRLAPPPHLDAKPDIVGQHAYIVMSPYWDDVLRGGREDLPRGADDADYFPANGYVRAHQGSEDVWLVLDARQRAILDRYIRLGLAGALTPTPGVFEVLRAAAATEPIGVQVGEITIDSVKQGNFWQFAARSVTYRPDQTQSTPVTDLPPDPHAVWITFNLSEGRSVQLLWQSDKGLLLGKFGEVYSVQDNWLESILGAAARPGDDFALGGGGIPQEQTRGSKLWWPLMLGGGAALLAGAYWLRRRQIEQT